MLRLKPASIATIRETLARAADKNVTRPTVEITLRRMLGKKLVRHAPPESQRGCGASRCAWFAETIQLTFMITDDGEAALAQAETESDALYSGCVLRLPSGQAAMLADILSSVTMDADAGIIPGMGKQQAAVAQRVWELLTAALSREQ